MKVFLKNGKLSKAGRKTLLALLGCNRFVTLSYSLYEQARELLNALGVPFIEGNDAPRGGKTGKLEYDFYTLYKKLAGRL